VLAYVKAKFGGKKWKSWQFKIGQLSRNTIHTHMWQHKWFALLCFYLFAECKKHKKNISYIL